jgi:glycosyltransferase involved in cell wall biosynthesis
VLLSVHNGERFLREAIDCILAQTFRDFELVIVDDASSDATPAILGEYEKTDARVRVIRSAENLRLAAALNHGLEHCRAELIARADADDVSLPHRLQMQWEYMRDHPQVGLISSHYQRMDENGRDGMVAELPTDSARMKFMLLWMTPICHGSAMYRKSVVLGVGGYDKSFWTAQDYELWSRVAPGTELGNVPQVLLRYRTHSASTTASRGRKGTEFGHSVSRRVMSQYLGRELSQELASRLKSLIAAFDPLNESEYGPALGLMRELVAVADAREPEDVRQWARETFAAALLKHSSMLSYSNARLSRELYREAMRLQPSLALNREGLKQLGRLAVLGPLRRMRTKQ